MVLGNSIKNAQIYLQNTWQLTSNINKCHYFPFKEISMTRQFIEEKERTKINSIIEKNSKFLPVNAVSTCPLHPYPGY